MSSLLILGTLTQTPVQKPAEVEVNPLQLQVRRKDSMNVMVNNWFDLNSGKQSSLEAFAKQADNYQFVFLGESHDDPVHHQMQANVIDALAKRGRNVIVGFEMFTRPNQENLNAWTLGKESEDDFIANAKFAPPSIRFQLLLPT